MDLLSQLHYYHDMWVAKRNVRAYNETFKKGEKYESPPKGFEKHFKKIGAKKIETAKRDIPSENRSKEDGRRNKRDCNTKRGKKPS